MATPQISLRMGRDSRLESVSINGKKLEEQSVELLRIGRLDGGLAEVELRIRGHLMLEAAPRVEEEAAAAEGIVAISPPKLAKV